MCADMPRARKAGTLLAIFTTRDAGAPAGGSLYAIDPSLNVSDMTPPSREGTWKPITAEPSREDSQAGVKSPTACGMSCISSPEFLVACTLRLWCRCQIAHYVVAPITKI